MFRFLKIFLSMLVFLLSYTFGLSFGNSPPNHPTIIKSSAVITDIQNLDEVNEQVQIDAIFGFEWNDPRLAYDKNDTDGDYKVYQGNFQFDEIFEGWKPQISIINEDGVPQIKSRQIRVYPDGHVIYREQRILSLETPMQLRRYPFDKQVLSAYIIAFGDDMHDVRFEINPDADIDTQTFLANHPNMDIAEWQLVGFELKQTSQTKEYYGKPHKISVLEFDISLKREPTNILLKVLVPLALLVLAMWAVFWMDAKSLSDRLNIAFIGILSVIAYQFLVEGEMPYIDYLTFTDAFLLISFSILFTTILESLIAFWFVKLNKESIAKKIDVFSRLAFPLTYVCLIVLLYFVYLH